MNITPNANRTIPLPPRESETTQPARAPDPRSSEGERGPDYTKVLFIADVGTTATYSLAGLGASALLGVPVVGAAVAATAMAYMLGRWGLWAMAHR